MKKQAGNLEYVKRINRINILNLIRENTNITRQQVAELTGLTPAAVSGIIRELTGSGYVEETGLGQSTGGRRPVKLRLNAQAGYVVGAEITSRKTVLGIVDLQARLIAKREPAIDMADPEQGLAALAAEIHKLIAASGVPVSKIMGVGLAIPGLVDARTKVVTRSPNLGEKWIDVPVRDLLQKHLGFHIAVEQNANAAALAEHTLGEGRKSSDMVYVNLGEGIGAGVIMNGDLVYGSLGYAGEIGHIVIMENGPLCNCGNRGCLGSLYAVGALVERANSELSLCQEGDSLKQIWKEKGAVSIEDILASAGQVGSYSGQLLQQAGWHLGIGIASLINLFNPEKVYLGGVLASAGVAMMGTLKESVTRHAFPAIARVTRLEVSKLGQEAGFYGACLAAIQHMFDWEKAEILARAGMI